jgi:ComF family protein
MIETFALIASLVGFVFYGRNRKLRIQIQQSNRTYRTMLKTVQAHWYERALEIVRNESVDNLLSPQRFGADGCIDERRSCGVYRKNKNHQCIQLLHRLKYERIDRREACLIAARLAGHLLEQYTVSGWYPSVIAAVPSNDAKLKERGFNQAELLAQELSAQTGVRYLRCLTKLRETDTQASTRLASERAKNIRGSIGVRGNVKGEIILLIDDVATTGSTLQECASALKNAGAQIVWALTLASGYPSKVKDV